MRGSLTHINSKNFVLGPFINSLRLVQEIVTQKSVSLGGEGLLIKGIDDLGSGTREWLFWPTYGHQQLKYQPAVHCMDYDK